MRLQDPASSYQHNVRPIQHILRRLNDRERMELFVFAAAMYRDGEAAEFDRVTDSIIGDTLPPVRAGKAVA